MIKRTLVLACALCVAGAALAQESEEVTVTTVTTGGEDLLTKLWFMEDATPVDPCQVDLRLGFQWMTASAPANLGDSDDDFILRPAIFWGAADNLELSLSVDAWLGDSGDMGPFEDGNYDTTIGLLWRFHEQTEGGHQDGYLHLPSMALSASARVPTGCGSEGVDGELRLIMTYEYDNGVRSHFNVFGKSVNGDNHETWRSDDDCGLDDCVCLDPRNFQYGAVIGFDGPLCADGAVRWVFDYMYRSSYYNGRTGMNMAELGWEWTMSEMHKLGMSVQIGLDHVGDTPNFGAGLMYALSLGS
jgi:hypothetical protein